MRAKCFVARASRRRLAAGRVEVERGYVAGQAKPIGMALDQGGDVVAVGMDAVIDMRDHRDESKIGTGLGQQLQERNRVGTTGDGDEPWTRLQVQRGQGSGKTLPCLGGARCHVWKVTSTVVPTRAPECYCAAPGASSASRMKRGMAASNAVASARTK